MQPNALIPEFAVADLTDSLGFYCGVLGFSVVYDRPEEGFAFIALGAAQIMLDQGDLGRTFDAGSGALEPPLGRGLNLQIRVESVASLAAALAAAAIGLYLPLEDKWYRRGGHETGNRQFVVADPDGYLLRFYQHLGTRPATESPAA